MLTAWRTISAYHPPVYAGSMSSSKLSREKIVRQKNVAQTTWNAPKPLPGGPRGPWNAISPAKANTMAGKSSPHHTRRHQNAVPLEQALSKYVSATHAFTRTFPTPAIMVRRHRRLQLRPWHRFLQHRRHAFVWQWPLPANIHQLLRTDANPSGTISINFLELAAHVVQYLLKTPHMQPLEHTLEGLDGTAAHGWATRSSVSQDDAIVGLLAWKFHAMRASITLSSTAYVPRPLNRLANDASRILLGSPLALIAFFNAKFSQKNSWLHTP